MPELRLLGGEVDGLDVHYLVETPVPARGGAGSAVVLVHGLGGFAGSWRHSLAVLGSCAVTHAIDLPGFGRSAKPRARYRLEYLAAALHGLVEGLGLPRVSLVGHSLGSAVVLTYALTRPARVDRLALLSPVVPGFDYRPSWAMRALAVPGVGEAVGWLGPRRLYTAALARCLHGRHPEEVAYLVGADAAHRAGPAARAAYLATLRGVQADFATRGADYRRALAALDVPALLVHGRRDPVVAPAHAEAIRRGLPRATVRWVDACGHFPHLEHPRLVNGWLAEFLTGRPAPR